MLQSYLMPWIDRFLVPIDDPTSRLFHLNLIFAVGFVFIWILATRKTSARRYFSKRYLKKLFFSKNYWWNDSTRTDYKIYIFNSILKIALFVPFLDVTYEISLGLVRVFQDLNLNFGALKADSFNLVVFTMLAFIWDDFLRFMHHYLMHEIPWLWRLHQVHHSAHTLTPMTLYRTHPLESAMATIRNSISLGVVTAIYVSLFQSQLSMTTILGINFFGFLFNLLGANLRHSHVPISFGIIERIFISPKQHQIHHSNDPVYFGKNLGVSLSIWDQIAGRYAASAGIKKLRFGLK